MTRTLIAGFGNVLRGDDGFGVEVLRRLGERGVASESVELLDVGTGGIRLAQELLTPYDRLIIIDASARGGAPGTVYTLIIDDVMPTREIDMHTAVPSRALEVARALGPLPAEIYLVGCEPGSVDELTTDFTPPVAAAVAGAVRRVEELLHGAARPPEPRHAGGSGDAVEPGSDIAREDEILELLYWFEGEGFGGVASIEGITRFANLPEPLVRRTLDRLVARGDVMLSVSRGTEYQLTVSGRREAARRFAAEFAPLLSQGHGECSDPDCDCHTSEGGAAECHGRTHTHTEHSTH
ncbi:MAG TPA: hydrogenase maturation protease [Gemmatimonadaceae bacterium]|nr:hydrogenase maturation protease [Gemmatimonadaceae bacterium]